MNRVKKAAVFVMLGQSNAVGHGVPMEDKDIIKEPLKNVFGLSREDNQSFDIKKLSWSGYLSGGMNLAEEQDNTYSVVNCLASLWQGAIDEGESLPDLYIVHIAIGAEGLTKGYMWHPDREIKLVPGKLGTVDISLYPFTMRILSLLDGSFRGMESEYEVIGIHWRGGENDTSQENEYLNSELFSLYSRMIDDFGSMLGDAPIALHRLIAKDRMLHLDPSGAKLERMYYINSVFEELSKKYSNVTVFEPSDAPQFVEGVLGNGVFKSDNVHFTPEVNRWVAQTVLDNYKWSIQ